MCVSVSEVVGTLFKEGRGLYMFWWSGIRVHPTDSSPDKTPSVKRATIPS